MKALWLLIALPLGFVSSAHAVVDRCAEVAYYAANTTETLNAKLMKTKFKLSQPHRIRRSLPSKGASLAYRVNVARPDGTTYFYVVQTRNETENCFIETIAYWYSE